MKNKKYIVFILAVAAIACMILEIINIALSRDLAIVIFGSLAACFSFVGVLINKHL